MPSSGPFANHHVRWSKAIDNLSSAHEQAKNEAVGHIHQRITAAAEDSPGMDPEHVGTFWYKGRPHISVQGDTADLEYGTLSQAPRATIRNAARRADRDAVKIYHSTFRNGLGI